ncbi:MAG: hypothetical protein ACRDUA_10905 [Micromonosporaceae bacterium]
MATAIILLAVLTIVLYALQRHHSRQTYLWPTLYGSSTAEDRDLERVRADLAAVAAAPSESPTGIHRPASPARPASRPTPPTRQDREARHRARAA